MPKLSLFSFFLDKARVRCYDVGFRGYCGFGEVLMKVYKLRAQNRFFGCASGGIEARAHVRRHAKSFV